MKKIALCILAIGMMLMISAGSFAEDTVSVVTETDKRNRVVLETRVDAAGNACMGPEGYASIQYRYERLETLPRLISYLDTEGNPCQTRDGYYAIQREYDARGWVTMETCLGEDGKPCNNTAGYSQVTSAYISTGDVQVRRYWGADGKAVIVPELGYAMLDNTYMNGRIVSTVYRDTEKKPIDCAKGYGCVQYRYEGKNVIEIRWLHADQKTPATNEDGYSRKEQKWDEEGNLTEVICYDEQDQALGTQKAALQAVSGKEYAYIRMAYSEDRKTCEVSYFDAEKQPMIIGAGYAKRICDLDDEGNIIRERYKDIHDAPVACTGGYAEIRRTYHTPELVSGVAWFDINGMPIPLKDIYVRLEREYDESDNIIAERYYDALDQLTLCLGGYAEARYSYNEVGFQVKASFHDTEGNPAMYKGFAIRTREYDMVGNMTAERYFDGNMNPVTNVNGYAELRRIYGADGKVALTRFYDTEGQLIAEQ